MGATCATQRPLSMARIRDDATCCVCTIVPVNDAPLVGLSTSRAPSSTPSRVRSGKKISHEIGVATRPTGPGTSRCAGQLADQRVAVGEGVAGDRLEERAERHELAEGHAVHLVVAVDHLARRRRRARRCCGRRRARRPRRCRRSSARRAPGRGRRPRRPTGRRRRRRRCRSRPRATPRGRRGGSTSSVASTWRSNTSITLGVGLAGALLAAALHERDLGGAHRVAARAPPSTATTSSDDAERDAAGPAATPAGPRRRRPGRPARRRARAAGCRPRAAPAPADPTPARWRGWRAARRRRATSSAGARRASRCRPARASGRGRAGRPPRRRRASRSTPRRRSRSPGAVSAVIQMSDGTKQPIATSQPRRNRTCAGWSAISRSRPTSPTRGERPEPERRQRQAQQHAARRRRRRRASGAPVGSAPGNDGRSSDAAGDAATPAALGAVGRRDACRGIRSTSTSAPGVRSPARSAPPADPSGRGRRRRRAGRRRSGPWLPPRPADDDVAGEQPLVRDPDRRRAAPARRRRTAQLVTQVPSPWARAARRKFCRAG